MKDSLLSFFFGRVLRNRESGEQKISSWEGVPALGLDALASSSYGPEAALSVLIPLGVAGAASVGYVMTPVLILLAILYVSYRQTIRAYPGNGGAYAVAKANLGTGASLVAAAALMIDYVLNVAIGISAGVGALTSMVTSLHSHTLLLCLGILALMTISNLRGTVESSRLFAVPTYLYIGSFLLIVAFGAWKVATGSGHASALISPPAPRTASESLNLWIILRAFAAGCTAMTGVEAISNGVSSFREPVVKTAHRTLGLVCGALALLLIGICGLARAYRIGAMDQSKEGYHSVLSQLAGAVVGHHLLYATAMTAAVAVLCLSANTSFSGFPLLCRVVANDDFLPRSFAVAGRRLVFSVGILYLAISSGILLIIFDGITDRLIPLFAIGAFLTFTLSQFGMVMHWRGEIQRSTCASEMAGVRSSLILNATGSVATALALVIIVLAKFTEGAWIILAVVPCFIFLLTSIHRYYQRIDRQMQHCGPIDLRPPEPPQVLVVAKDWNNLTDKALRFGLRLSPDVTALHCTELAGPSPTDRQVLLQRWRDEVESAAVKAGATPPKLLLLEASYRKLAEPLLQTIDRLTHASPHRLLVVLLPDVIKRHWWQHLLHSHRAQRVRRTIQLRGNPNVIVVEIPWYLD